MAFSAKARISLIARGARFLKLTPWHYNQWKEGLQLVFRPNAIWEEIKDPDPCENFFWFGHRGGLHKTNFFFLSAMPTGKEDPDWFLRKGVSRSSLQRTSQDPAPDRQTVDLSFFSRQNAVVWLEGVSKERARAYFSFLKFPFFAPMCAHTLIFLIEETPYFRRVCSLSVCASTDSSQNRFSRVRQG